MHLDDFSFDLPNELIARYPLAIRSASKLLQVSGEQLQHRGFTDVIDLVNPGDLLVFNNTKVIPARFFGKKATGGNVEVLVERILDSKRILVQLRVSKTPRIGDVLFFPQDIQLQLSARTPQFFELRYDGDDRTVLEIIAAIGQIPLPPYMDRAAEPADKERYQTIYAQHDGSVAAPTAGFHFDETLMAQLDAKQVQKGYLTLHIGAGTFMPVRVENVLEHKMHAEYLEVSAELCAQIKATKANGKRVITVGTTSMRALETASQSGTTLPYQGETRIFIYPGYQFNCVDALITNLHLPRSTLLMLVSAFGGHQQLMAAYQEAVKNHYRFYSYGDAMWVDKLT